MNQVTKYHDFLFTGLGQEEKKEGGSMIKTANFLEPAKSGDKTEKNPSIPSIHIREISNENKPEVSITNSAVIEGENPTNQARLDKSNKENNLRTKLQSNDTFGDKPEYFTYIKNGLNEVKKLKDLVESLYSQMNTKVKIKNLFKVLFSLEARHCG